MACELSDEEISWQNATSVVAHIGPLLRIYSATIRAIRSAPSILKTTDSEQINRFAVGGAQLPVKVSPTMKAAFYFAAIEQSPELEQDPTYPKGTLTLLRTFEAEQISAIIGLTYLYRLIIKRCDEKEFVHLLPLLSRNMALGQLFEGRIKGIAKGHGMMIGGIQVLALAVLLSRDVKAFRGLMKRVEAEGTLSQAAFEIERFGCSHLQVCSVMLRELGFGFASSLAFGMQVGNIDDGKTTISQAEPREEFKGWTAAIKALDNIATKKPITSGFEPEQATFFNANAGQDLIDAVQEVYMGEGMRWVRRSGREIPEEIRSRLKISDEVVE